MHDSKKITIAIDGYSSCGKSTIAKALAKALNYTFIDTGAMYRAITVYALETKLIENAKIDVKKLIDALPNIEMHFQFDATFNKNCLYLNGLNIESKIRTPEVASLVSQVASIKEVRQKLVDLQKKMGLNGGVVMDGRDIGSVVFPNAELKLFITAQVDVRAKRRYDELKQLNIESNFQDVLQNLIERDHIDTTRKESPLIQTKDAILIDTSNLNEQEQLNIAKSHADKIISIL